MLITNAAIKNRTTVLVLIFLIIVAGAYCYVSLPRESFPDVTIPIVLVSTTYEGVSPEDVETSVTMKLEDKLAGLKGLKEMSSSSAEGMSLIKLEFHPDVVIEDALQYVRDRVDLAKPDLPDAEERKEPVLTEINVADFPIFMVNISGDISPVRLKTIADRLEEEFERIPGVLESDVMGALEREIRLEIDPDRLAAYRLTIPEIMEVIPSENVNISAGGLETPGMKFNIRVPAELDQPEQVNLLPLVVHEGKTIYLSDIATLNDTFKDRETISRLNGKPTITVTLKKRVGQNILPIIRRAKAVLAEFRNQAPAGVTFEVTLDQSKDVRMMISDLENNIFSGLVLVVLVLVLFMGVRTSTIVALAIPMSMLLSFMVLKVLGYTLNMMILFGLIMALGMLVDNAIVIVENIYRHMQMGYNRVQAAMKGTAEVGWPVITSTATTLAAFGPMMFWPGMMGEFMKFLPITLIITLSCSLFVAMIISPTICSFLSGGARKRENGSKHHPFVAAYRGLLGAALRHRALTLTAATMMLLVMFVVFGIFNHGVELFPEMDPNRGIVDIRCPQGTSIHESDRLAREIEQRIAPHHDDHELDYVVTSVGMAGGEEAVFMGATGGAHRATVTLIFKDFEERQKESDDALKQMRTYLADIPGAEIQVEKQREGPPTGAAVTVRIIGRDFKELEKLSREARKLIEDVPGLVNLRSDYEAAKPELTMTIDRRRAALLGLNTRTIGHFLKTNIFGARVGIYREFKDEYDITVRLPESQRTNIEDTLRLRVPNRTGTAVPLSSLGTFTYAGGFGTISHIDQDRVITVSADAEGRLSDKVLADAEGRLSKGRAILRSDDVLDFPSLCRRILGAKAGTAGARLLDKLEDDVVESLRRVARAGSRGAQATPTKRSKTEQAVVAGDKAAILNAINACIANAMFYEEEDVPKEGLEEDERDALTTWWPWRFLFVKSATAKKLNRLALAGLFSDVVRPMEQLELNQGYYIRYAGEKEESEKAQAFLLKAGTIAVLLIVLILVTQFNTVSAPLIIMATVPLSLVGVLGGLLICRMPFGIIMTGVGVISLAGIVVNNAIVLLDYTRQLQRRGKELIEAAVEAGATRLRPVMLTATTTILGLLPMAIGKSFDIHTFSFALKSESSQWWSHMAIAVIFGLAFATLLTLFVVPALYVSLYRLAARMGLGGLKHVGENSNGERIEKEDF